MRSSNTHSLYPLCRRYGLLGPNGCGKSTLLDALANREVPIPDHIDLYYLNREAPASDMTALEMVMSVDAERIRLEKEAESLSDQDMTPEIEQRLSDVYERCVVNCMQDGNTVGILLSKRLISCSTCCL